MTAADSRLMLLMMARCRYAAITLKLIFDEEPLLPPLIRHYYADTPNIAYCWAMPILFTLIERR